MRHFISTLSATALMSFCFLAGDTHGAADPNEAEREAIIATVNAFFTAMRSRSAKDFAEILTSQGQLHGYSETEDGLQIVSVSYDEYVSSLQSGEGQLVERMWDADVQVHDRLATLWAPYDLYIDGQFSHCGIDVFTLLKTADGWRISGGVFSMEKTGCDDHPLGPPASTGDS